VDIPLPFYAPLDALPALELNFLIEHLFLFFLNSIRLSAFLISSPFLGSRNVPLNAKIVFSMAISFFHFSIAPDLEINDSLLDNLALIVLIEAIIGIASGLTLTIWFSAASMAGEKIAASTGLGFSALVDPETGGQTPVLSIVLDLFLITIFISLDGHLLAIDFLMKSYEILELGTRLPTMALVGAGIEAAGAMFYAAGLIMLPVVGGLMLTNVAIGVITKSAPQLNLFSFGFPISLILAFIILYLSTRSMGGAFAELTNNALTSLENILGLL
tara:strand:- start:10227 stop:11045 length:819 start_codon:yes stop_codon:yes gene_type:complete